MNEFADLKSRVMQAAYMLVSATGRPAILAHAEKLAPTLIYRLKNEVDNAVGELDVEQMKFISNVIIDLMKFRDKYIDLSILNRTEPGAPGRKTFFDKPMKQTTVWLPEDMIDWLKSQPGGLSETIRIMITKSMIDSEKQN